jgi:hypothetical protein
MPVLFQAYHQAHLEAIKGFGMHGYEIEFESLVEEYQVPVNAYYSRWLLGCNGFNNLMF